MRPIALKISIPILFLQTSLSQIFRGFLHDKGLIHYLVGWPFCFSRIHIPLITAGLFWMVVIMKAAEDLAPPTCGR